MSDTINDLLDQIAATPIYKLTNYPKKQWVRMDSREIYIMALSDAETLDLHAWVADVAHGTEVAYGRTREEALRLLLDICRANSVTATKSPFPLETPERMRLPQGSVVS